MVEFPLPSLGNDLLPEGAEATIDVPVKSCDFTVHVHGKKKKKSLKTQRHFQWNPNEHLK